MSTTNVEQFLNPNRSCAGCSLCCKLGEVPGIKGLNEWCQHCSTRAGCDIHLTRPQVCRDFFCHYLLSDCGDHWQPKQCRMIISTWDNPRRMIITVDASRRDVWKKEPFISDIKHWSTQAQVTVMVGLHHYIVYPDHIDDLGDITSEHHIMTIEEQTPQGPRKRSVRILRSEAPPGLEVGKTVQLPHPPILN